MGYNLILFSHSNYSSFSHWEHFQIGFCVLLTWPHHFSNTPLLCCTKICSELVLYVPCHSPGNNPFFKKPWFLLLENSAQNQYLGSRWASYYWVVIISRPSHQTELGNICVYTNQAYTRISIPLSVCLYTKNHEFMQTPIVSIQQHRVYSILSLFFTYNIFSSKIEKPSSHYPQYVFFSVLV